MGLSGTNAPAAHACHVAIIPLDLCLLHQESRQQITKQPASAEAVGTVERVENGGDLEFGNFGGVACATDRRGRRACRAATFAGRSSST